MAPELALGGLQRWMQAVIVHPGTVGEALAARETAALVPPARLGDVLLPSATLAAEERIGIYHGMYMLRMSEALESDYPGLAHFLGPERWGRLVRDYVQAHPSRSYTLNILGRELPDFVRTARGVPRPAFCRDLARLEWAVTEVFDASETPPLEEADLAALAPETWATVTLVPVEAMRLVVVDHNVGEYLDSVKAERQAGPPARHPAPRRGRARIVVYRQAHAVFRREVPARAFALLCDLARGTTLGRAVGRVLSGRDAPTESELFAWFRQWASMRIFRKIERP
jgi:hypothetical protein